MTLRVPDRMAGRSGNEQIHTCYYSNQCKWSKAFFEALGETPWKYEFRFICVDPSPQRGPLPKWLQKVPTLVIKGEDAPRTDAEVMNWIYERKMREPAAFRGSQGPAAQANEIAGYMPNEMDSAVSGYQYSFVDADTTPGGSGGSTMPGNFQFLNGGAAPGDRTTQSIGTRGGANSNEGRSKKELQFDNQMEQYKRDRDAALAQPVRRV